MGDDEARRARIEKYDRAAEAGYSSRYADPAVVARGQVRMLVGWGTRLPTGGRVLELGCADGLVTEVLAAEGFAVTAVDFSPRMIDQARERLRRAGLEADFRVADVSALTLDDDYDAVLGLMRTFFGYVEDPARVLSALANHTRRKLLVDVNPRTHPLSDARSAVAEAGFRTIAWRPFFVPGYHRVGRGGLTVLRSAERLPGVRGVLLRRKFNAVVKGER